MNAYNNQPQNAPAMRTISATDSNMLEAHASADSKPSLNNGLAVLQAIKNIKNELFENGGVSKSRRTDSNNDKFSYNYRSIGDINRVIAPLMNKYDLICFPHTESVACAKYVNGKGDIVFKVFVTMRFTFVSSIDGSSFEVCIIGEANDSGDKAVAKATTAAEKMLYEKTFNITSDIENGKIQSPPQQNSHQQSPKKQNQRKQDWTGNGQFNWQDNSQPNQPNHNDNELASLMAKNTLDERLRKYNVTLKEAIQHHGFDFLTLTRGQLITMQNDAVQRFKKT